MDNWWADFGGLLGRGSSWSAFDYVVFAIVFPVCVVAGWYFGRLAQWYYNGMHLPYKDRLKSRE